MMMSFCIKYFPILLGMLWTGLSYGQGMPVTEADTSRTDQVQVDFADLFEYSREGQRIIQRLLGNVELRQDSVYMYCDTAIIYDEIDVVARGKVIIQQGDSVSVFSDSLIYMGKEKLADLFGEVILTSGNQKLFTDELRYDLNQKLATYETGALLTNDTTQLTSKRGYFYVQTDEVFFKDSVQIVDPNFELKADTLAFNTRTQVATFLGPTLITYEESRIYCESGFYDIRNEKALFREHAQYRKDSIRAAADSIFYDGALRQVSLMGNAFFREPGREASADYLRYDEANEIYYLEGHAVYREGEKVITSDTIVYDKKRESYATRGRSLVSDPPQLIEADRIDYEEEAGMALAMGDVIWQDTSEELTIRCAQAAYNEQTDYLKASGDANRRPLLITVLEEDSLFLSADTLVAFRSDTAATDSSRTLLAFRDVRIFKSNLQAVCDSLVYQTADSLFWLLDDPIIWSDTSQFYADTVLIQLANDRIHRIYLRERAFILNSPDELFFNQMKGRTITAFFEESELRRMLLEGNAESVYYAIDAEDAYIGANKTVCSRMLVLFGDNQVDEIRFYREPKGTFFPMQKTNHGQLRLEGFRWEMERRPQNLEDLLKPNTDETEMDLPLDRPPVVPGGR